jgi:succinyl-diaminopimelate desuccinylase
MPDVRSMISSGDLSRMLQDLVAIDSTNADVLPGAAGERDVARYVSEFLKSIGLEVGVTDVEPGRPNVTGLLRVPGAAKTLLLDSHMDTMPAGGMGDRALRPEIRDGRLYGRGSCDDKASLAAMLHAMRVLRDLRGDLSINVMMLASMGEENTMAGAKQFASSGVHVEAAIVGEPTDLAIVIAHKGYLRIRVRTLGRAAHTSEPSAGDSAIYQMADVIALFRDKLQGRWNDVTHPLLTPPTIAIGKISGGQAVNIVPAECAIDVDRRLLPHEDPDRVLAEVDEALAELSAREPGLTIRRDPPSAIDRGLDTPATSAVVRSAARACEETLGRATVKGVSYGTHAAPFWRIGGIPSIVLGPGSIAQAHTADEYVELDQLARATEIYCRAALAGLGEA